MDIVGWIREHILREHLPGEDSSQLGNDDDLISSGVLDSFAIVRLVAHLEETFRITVRPGDITPDNFRSVRALAEFLRVETAG
jgi:acyl carrier protein